MALGAAAAIATVTGAAAGAAAAAAPKPAKTVKGSLIKAQPHTLEPGTKLKASAVGFPRAFVNGRTGWALASTAGADYPAITTDSGSRWRTAGPALHLDALQAPLSVTQIGATSSKVAYAYGGGQVADVTTDGGKHWYRGVFPGTDMAVVPSLGIRAKQLETFVNPESTTAGSAWQYQTSNGGRSWKLSPGGAD